MYKILLHDSVKNIDLRYSTHCLEAAIEMLLGLKKNPAYNRIRIFSPEPDSEIVYQWSEYL